MKKLLPIFAFLLVSSQLFAQYPNASYPFNGNANDATFNANHGVVTGATLTTDRFGNTDKAYSFAGGNNVITAPDGSAFNFTNYLSASAWIYISTTPPAAGGGTAYSIVSKNEGSGNNQKKWLFGLQNGNLAFHNNGPGLGSGEWIYSNNFTLTQNKWYHVAFVKTGQELTFYVNAENLGTFSLLSTFLSPAASLQIGNSENALQFVGKLDEVNLWGNTLTQKEIEKQYYAQSQVACYKFNENTFDDSGNNNNGNNTTTATSVDDRFGNANAAFSFTTADFIEVLNSNSFQIGTNDYTLQYWIKTTAADAVIMGKGPHTILGIMQYVNGDGTIQGRSEFPDGILNSDIAINNNVWHQVVFVRKGTTSKIFIDGRLSNLAILPLSDISNMDSFYIGHDGPEPFAGQLDDVKIYNVALTDASIFDNYIKDQTLPGSGNALQLNGANYLEVPDHDNFNFGNSFTAASWIKTTSFNADIFSNFEEALPFSGTLLGIGFGSNGNNSDARAGKLGFYIGNANGNISESYNDLSGPRVDDNKWHNVAVTYNGLEVKFYVDGINTSTLAANGNPIGNSNKVLRIGRDNNEPGVRYFNGSIDELQLWNQSLSQKEIRDWMCKKITSAHPQYNKLKAYFNFDEKNQTIAQARRATVLNPTVRGFGGHFGELINGSMLQASGAAIGDASAYSYSNLEQMTTNKSSRKTSTLLNPVQIYNTTGENFTVTSAIGNPDAIQVYHVLEAPNTTSGLNQTDPFPHYFGVFQVGGTSPTYTATYNYFGQNVPTDETNLRLYSRTNNTITNWTEYPALPNTSNKTIELTGQNTEYILAGGLTTLPLNLLSFSGKNENGANLLNWQTANEVALSHFEIERSKNAKNFEIIGEVKANGGPSEKVEYEFFDSPLTPLNSQLFYRLKMVDLDGSFKYSKIINIENKLQSELKVYPNPTSDYFSILGNEHFEKLQIVDAAGRIVKEYLPQNENKYELKGLGAGVYFVKIINREFLVTNKLIIK